MQNNAVLLETWMKEAKAPAVEYVVELFHKIKGKGFKILLISSRKEHLRGVTVDNLAKAGYYDWDQLKLRFFFLSICLRFYFILFLT